MSMENDWTNILNSPESLAMSNRVSRTVIMFWIIFFFENLVPVITGYNPW